jgi:hypothetical protein
MMHLCQLGSVISYGHGKDFGVDLYEVDEVLNPCSEPSQADMKNAITVRLSLANYSGVYSDIGHS